jgi:hypothetical protein
MMSEMQADVTATISALLAAEDAVKEARQFAQQVNADLNRRITPLPAPALTERAIVDTLKADPGMAGRVVVLVAREFGDMDRERMNAAASERANDFGAASIVALQSLAVALAAASYRG